MAVPVHGGAGADPLRLRRALPAARLAAVPWLALIYPPPRKNKFHLDKQSLRRLLSDLWPGAALLLAWFAFSLIYFGAPFPNTYYAKLHAGYPDAEVLERGWNYFAATLGDDPASFAIMFAAQLMSIASRNRALLMLTAGQLLYMVFILNAGGDFMAGRFFAVPVFLSVGQMVLAFPLLRGIGPALLQTYSVAALALLMALIGGGRHLFLSADEMRYENEPNGVADERFMQHGYGNSLKTWAAEPWPEIQSQPEGGHGKRYFVQCGGVGVLSWPGPRDYLIDDCALTDPLLARLPAVHFPNWRTGHHHRMIPTDWGAYLTGEASALPDSELNGLAADLLLAMRGDIFSAARFAAIWRLNTGRYAGLDLQRYTDFSTYPQRSSLPARFVSAESLRDTWSFTGRVHFNRSLHVEVDDARPVSGLQLSLDCDDTYELYGDGQLLVTIEAQKQACRGLVDYSANFPTPAPLSEIEIRAVSGKGSYGLGYMRLSHPE